MGTQLDMFEARQETLPLASATLNETLRALGYLTRPAALASQREVVDTAGRVVFVGTADSAWQWLAAGRPEVER